MINEYVLDLKDQTTKQALREKLIRYVFFIVVDSIWGWHLETLFNHTRK